ncbi:unnamed protein product [Allacma fusca]|uniref:Uncharacterized protein n=1 Tax=Allacma fusca TaxID=39272 RepID=A0A8J2KJU9_9HEXA|nr:unnamed protein product [Allacma fusca]
MVDSSLDRIQQLMQCPSMFYYTVEASSHGLTFPCIPLQKLSFHKRRREIILKTIGPGLYLQRREFHEIPNLQLSLGVIILNPFTAPQRPQVETLTVTSGYIF